MASAMLDGHETARAVPRATPNPGQDGAPVCSIFGAVGDHIDEALLDAIRQRARDRGRDGGRSESFDLSGGRRAILGNWRAVPTPEVEAPFQPYDGLVHNGTIANDHELGARPGEVDSMVLARVLDRSSAAALARSLDAVRGSYAIACVNDDSVLLAANYRPIHYWSPDDGRTVYFSSMARHFDGLLPRGQQPVRLSPYSVLDLTRWETATLHRTAGEGVVVIASSGLDSTVVATQLAREGRPVCLLHFRYGCRAEGREVERIERIAAALECEWAVLELPYASMKADSPLLDGSREIADSVPGAEFAHEWVPARNTVMIAIALAYAEARGFGAVALGNNLEEAGAYPDNEEQYTLLLDQAAVFAVQNGVEVRVLSPVGHLMKHEIVRLGLELGAPFEHTWSCYRGGERHCGHCGPCFMRRTAFERAGSQDPVFAHPAQSAS